MKSKERQNEHISGALLAFVLLIFIPVFLSNIIFTFNPESMGNGWTNFMVVLFIDIVLIFSYVSSLKDVEYKIEKILYSSLTVLMILGALGIIYSKLLGT
ncbi:hypothetical protein [Alteribacillus sp. HJP-4]|uniref:hypothetical protein n=1 Tax=Alteribacillus sp. HJP-4 TaxID=2775394 RepID=UPI0035CD3AC4